MSRVYANFAAGRQLLRAMNEQLDAGTMTRDEADALIDANREALNQATAAWNKRVALIGARAKATRRRRAAGRAAR